MRVTFSPLSSVTSASFDRSSFVSSSINLNGDRQSVRCSFSLFDTGGGFGVSHLSLGVFEGDRILVSFSSSGSSSMGVSREMREAWDCDPASEAILSASLRASWASWKDTPRRDTYDLELFTPRRITLTPLRPCVDSPPAGAEFWSQVLAACGRFPAASPDTVSAALPHCDWSRSQLLCW